MSERRKLSGSSEQWPELYIIGAPKCGTTALALYLAEHPNISFCRPKEPTFFATDLPKQRLVGTAQEYLKLFPPDKSRPTVRAEGSVWYLYSREAIPNILSVRPDAKFVVMLRNPIDAAYALHNQKLRSLDEDVALFEEAFHRQEKRRKGEGIPVTCREPSTLLYGDVCKYGEQVKRLFGLVDSKHVKAIVFEDFGRETERVYRETLELVRLDDDGRRTFERINESSRVRSRFFNTIARRPSVLRQRVTNPIKKFLGVRHLGVSAAIKNMNKVTAPRTPLSPEIRRELAAYFAEDIGELSKLLGLDLRYWTSPDAEVEGDLALRYDIS